MIKAIYDKIKSSGHNKKQQQQQRVMDSSSIREEDFPINP